MAAIPLPAQSKSISQISTLRHKSISRSSALHQNPMTPLVNEAAVDHDSFISVPLFSLWATCRSRLSQSLCNPTFPTLTLYSESIIAIIDCTWIAFGHLVGKFELKDMIEVCDDNSRVCFDNAKKAERCTLLCWLHGMHQVRECFGKHKDIIKTGCVDCSSSIN